jgi:hypothetical protein
MFQKAGAHEAVFLGGPPRTGLLPAEEAGILILQVSRARRKMRRCRSGKTAYAMS